MKPIVLALTCATAAVIGAAANAAAADQYISNPAWKAAPSRADVTAALLSHAKALRQPVNVSLGCQLKPDGGLTACGELFGPQRGRDIRDTVMALVPKFAAYFPTGVDHKKGPVSVTVDFHFVPPDQPTAPVVLIEPQLRTVRGAAQPSTAMPDAAAKAGYKAGVGVVECEGTASGALASCTVVKETPASVGFGQAALAFVKAINLNPWQKGEPMQGSKVRIPIYFNAPDAGHDSSVARQAIFHLAHRPPSGTAGPYFPERAMRMGVNGSAVIECVLSGEGVLDDCVPISESAPDFGFVSSSIMMAEHGVITAAPRLVDGRPVDGEVVQVTVPFNLP